MMKSWRFSVARTHRDRKIIASGATREELMKAYAWHTNDEALVNEGRSLPSGRIGELLNIISALEEEKTADPGDPTPP